MSEVSGRWLRLICVCPNFVMKIDAVLINQLLDLVTRFGQLCGWKRNVPSSVCVRALSQPTLWDHGRLVAAGVRFDVLRLDIGDLVRAVSPLLGYVDIADGAQLPGATAARPRTGDTGLCGWWKFVTRGRGLWLLQSVGRRAPLCSDVQAGGIWIWIGDTQQGSVACLQVTGSLLF